MGKEHARIYAESKGAELVGVHDSNPDTAKKIAEKCRTRAFSSLEEMVEAVEAASIVTPTTTHLAIAAPFLKKGKHVLVEKPIAMDTAEARELVNLADQHGAKLAVGHVERFNPVLAALEVVGRRPDGLRLSGAYLTPAFADRECSDGNRLQCKTKNRRAHHSHQHYRPAV
jgi:predicted dehydrogenase